MADTAFGIQELNLIGASGTPTIESPNNLNLTAVNVAISTDASVGGTLTVHQIDGNITGAGATFTDGINLKYASVSGAASTVTYVVKVATKSANHRWQHQGSSSGYTINGIESPLLTLKPGVDYVFDQSDSSNATHPIRFYYDAKKSAPYSTHLAKTFNFDITNNGSGAYTFTASPDRAGSVSGDDPTVTIWVGDTIAIKNNASSSHPLNINRSNTTGTSARVDTPAATNQGTSGGGIVSWTPNTPGTYFYNCQNHGFMAGTIKVLNPPGVAYCSGSSNTIENVIKAGSAGAATTISIQGDTPTTVHYQCLAHGYMGHALVSNTFGTTGNPDLTVAGIVTAKTFVPTAGQLSHRNLLINGSMTVAQRGTSSTTSGFGSLDRWDCRHNGNDEDPTHSQHALTSADIGPWEKGFRYSYHMQNGNQTSGAGAGDYNFIFQSIEAQNLAGSGWDYNSSSSYVTLSFWVKASVAQNYYGYIRTLDGTGQSIPYETGSLTANVWKYVTVTVPGNPNSTVANDNGVGMRIYWAPFIGTDYTANSKTVGVWSEYVNAERHPDMASTWYTTNDATFEITGVQFEVGEAATPFEHRSYGDEFNRCLRYYWKMVGGSTYSVGNGMAWAATEVDLPVRFPVNMRTIPTLDQSTGSNYFQIEGGGQSPATYVDGNWTLQFANEIQGNIYATPDQNLTAGRAHHIVARETGAKIAFTAEL